MNLSNSNSRYYGFRPRIWQDSAWFTELDHQLWDKQIEADAASGKLDRLIAEARSDFKAGKAREI